MSVYTTALNWLYSPSLCQRIKGGDYCNTNEITSIDLLAAVTQVGIKGLTGDLSFNGTAPDRRRSYFDIFQYNSSGFPNQVGYWNITGVFLSADQLEWKALPKSEGGNGQGGNSSTYVPLSSRVIVISSYCTC